MLFLQISIYVKDKLGNIKNTKFKMTNTEEPEYEIGFCCNNCFFEGNILVSETRYNELKALDLYEECEDCFNCQEAEESSDCEESEEEDEEDYNSQTSPPYYCDGGCGKKMGEGYDHDCQRKCDECESSDESELGRGGMMWKHQCPKRSGNWAIIYKRIS